MAAQWCIECWNAFKQRTPATRVIEDDPYCAGCAVRLGLEDAPEKIEAAGVPAGIASAGRPGWEKLWPRREGSCRRSAISFQLKEKQCGRKSIGSYTTC